MSDIYEVMEYGSVIASDSEAGHLMTVNGAYFNLWVTEADGGWVCVECYDVESRINNREDGSWRGIYGVDIVKLQDAATEILEHLWEDGEEE